MIKIRLAVFAALINVVMLQAQTRAPEAGRLVIRVGVVEVERGNAWLPIGTGDTLRPGDRVRTGTGSSAAIEVAPDRMVTLNQASQIRIGSTDKAPLVELENGSMKVFAGLDMQLGAKDTRFEVAERPLDLELGYEADNLNLTIFGGSVRNGAVTIRGGNQNPNARTYSAGGRLPRNDVPLAIPSSYYIYPYFVYGNQVYGNQVRRNPNAGAIVPPVVNNPTNPGYRPTQIVPPMSDPIRVPVKQ